MTHACLTLVKLDAELNSKFYHSLYVTAAAYDCLLQSSDLTPLNDVTVGAARLMIRVIEDAVWTQTRGCPLRKLTWSELDNSFTWLNDSLIEQIDGFMYGNLGSSFRGYKTRTATLAGELHSQIAWEIANEHR